jgi:hypothetical protein
VSLRGPLGCVGACPRALPPLPTVLLPRTLQRARVGSVCRVVCGAVYPTKLDCLATDGTISYYYYDSLSPSSMFEIMRMFRSSHRIRTSRSGPSVRQMQDRPPRPVAPRAGARRKARSGGGAQALRRRRRREGGARRHGWAGEAARTRAGGLCTKSEHTDRDTILRPDRAKERHAGGVGGRRRVKRTGAARRGWSRGGEPAGRL